MTTHKGTHLTRRVRGQVHFSFYRDGALWYACDDGWEFPVPVSDTDNPGGQGATPTFLRDDKGITFMRWIRRHMTEEQRWRSKGSSVGVWPRG